MTLWRFIQGLGGCAGMVMARATVRDVSEGPAIIRLMSRLVPVVTLAPILAPSIGSLLLGLGGWRAIFWALVACGAGLATVVCFIRPETLPPERRRRDAPLGILMVYLRMLSNCRFMGLTLSGVLPMAGLFANIAGSPFVFMELHRVAPVHYGFFFGGNAVGLMAVAPLNSWLSTRQPPERVLLFGLLSMAAAGIALVVFANGGSFVGVVVRHGDAGILRPRHGPPGAHGGQCQRADRYRQFGGGAVAVGIVGALHDGTAIPMAVVIAVAWTAGLPSRLILVR